MSAEFDHREPPEELRESVSLSDFLLQRDIIFVAQYINDLRRQGVSHPVAFERATVFVNRVRAVTEASYTEKLKDVIETARIPAPRQIDPGATIGEPDIPLLSAPRDVSPTQEQGESGLRDLHDFFDDNQDDDDDYDY